MERRPKLCPYVTMQILRDGKAAQTVSNVTMQILKRRKGGSNRFVGRFIGLSQTVWRVTNSVCATLPLAGPHSHSPAKLRTECGPARGRVAQTLFVTRQTV